MGEVIEEVAIRHPFPKLYERAAQGGGLYIGNSIWRSGEMFWVFSMQQLYVECFKLGLNFHDAPVVNDAMISRSRSRAASAFLKTDRDVLLMIDSDIQFRPQDALRIAELAYEHDIVGGAYAKRSGENTSLAVRWLPGDFECAFMPGAPLHEVEYLSTGFLAIHRRVFEKLLETHAHEDIFPHHLKERGTDGLEDFTPFFRDKSREIDSNHLFLSEDWSLLERAREAGFKVWLDPTIRLGHVGSYVYTLEDTVRPQRLNESPLRFMRTGPRMKISVGTPSMRTADNFSIFLDPEDMAVSESLRRTGFWDKETRDALLPYLQPGTNFLDIGAHIGYFSLLAASKGCDVIAVEPMPAALDLFRMSIKANEFEELIDIQECAVSDFIGACGMHLPSQRNTGEAFLADGGDVKVMVRSLADILGGAEPDVVKLDVEGEEYRVLNGNREAFNSVQAMVIEVSEEQLQRNSGVGASDLFELLNEMGFVNLRLIVQHETYADWLATR